MNLQDLARVGIPQNRFKLPSNGITDLSKAVLLVRLMPLTSIRVCFTIMNVHLDDVCSAMSAGQVAQVPIKNSLKKGFTDSNKREAICTPAFIILK